PTGPVAHTDTPGSTAASREREAHEEYDRRVKDWVKGFEEQLPVGVSNDPYVYVKANSLTKAQCVRMIQKYESEPRYQHKGATLGGYNPSMKKTRELHVSSNPAWKEQDTLLCEALRRALGEYARRTASRCNNPFMLMAVKSGDCMDTGYQLQKYD
ncbi:unnamed protein product, partial [marine sediment metagenome]